MVHVAYFWALAGAYRWGDLSYAYPIMRGGAPVLVALASAAVFGEVLSGAQSAAVALICAGILADLGRSRISVIRLLSHQFKNEGLQIIGNVGVVSLGGHHRRVNVLRNYRKRIIAGKWSSTG